MNIGLTVSKRRISPCLSGVSLWIVGDDGDMDDRLEIDTLGWEALAWGRELMRRDVGLLFCAGLDQFLWGALQGNGIDVVPDAIGDPSDVVGQWRRGELKLSSEWPRHLRGGGRRERNRARCRRRRGRQC